MAHQNVIIRAKQRPEAPGNGPRGGTETEFARFEVRLFRTLGSEMRVLQFAISAFLLGMSATAVIADDGFWTADTAFTQVEAACMRQYTCGIPLSVYNGANRAVIATSPRMMFGVCTAGEDSRSASEPVDTRSKRAPFGTRPTTTPVKSCDICLTNPPADRCEWRIVKR